MVAMMLRASIGRDPTYVWINRHRKTDSEGSGALGNLSRDPTYVWINRHHKSDSEGSEALDNLTGDPTYAWINRHRKIWAFCSRGRGVLPSKSATSRHLRGTPNSLPNCTDDREDDKEECSWQHLGICGICLS